MVQRTDSSDLFFRWFLVVYMPLGLLFVTLALLPFGILPGWAAWLLVLLAAYAVLAVRLLIERKRSRLGVPLPRKFIVSLAVLSGMLALGVLLFVLGMGALTTSRGLAMVFVGGCLMILSVTVPTFRLVDILLRKGGRFLASLMREGPPARSPNAATTVKPKVQRRKPASPRPAGGRTESARASRRPPGPGLPASVGGGNRPAQRRALSASSVARAVAHARGGRGGGGRPPSTGGTGPLRGLSVPPSRPPEG